MGKIIRFSDITHISAGRDQQAVEGILPAREVVVRELAADHTCEPIKSLDDIRRISDYLVGAGRYRDNMLFVCGINFGLRVSDLLMLRFCDLISDDMTFRDAFPILEKKTRSTRKVKQNRYITINEAVRNSVLLYLRYKDGVSLSDHMFRCEGNRACNTNAPLNRKSVDRILKEVGDQLGLDIKIATHSLRKTFAYHQMAASGNDPRKLLLLQKMFGHSSVMQTLTYIGITQEEMSDAYKELNLGLRSGFDLPIDSEIIEDAM